MKTFFDLETWLKAHESDQIYFSYYKGEFYASIKGQVGSSKTLPDAIENVMITLRRQAQNPVPKMTVNVGSARSYPYTPTGLQGYGGVPPSSVCGACSGRKTIRLNVNGQWVDTPCLACAATGLGTNNNKVP